VNAAKRSGQSGCSHGIIAAKRDLSEKTRKKGLGFKAPGASGLWRAGYRGTLPDIAIISLSASPLTASRLSRDAISPNQRFGPLP
jgi:hypothetical protein